MHSLLELPVRIDKMQQKILGKTMTTPRQICFQECMSDYRFATSRFQNQFCQA